MTEELVITVATKKAKDKGGFEIVDSLGNKYLVSVKNASVADALVEGRASKVAIASTTYGKYINSASLWDGISLKPEAPKPVVESTTIPIKGKIIPEVGKNKSFALAYAKDLAVSDKIKVEEIISYATVFDMYLSGDFSESKSEILAKYIAKYGRKDEEK